MLPSKRRWRKTEAGKASRRRWKTRYRRTPRGRAARKASLKRRKLRDPGYLPRLATHLRRLRWARHPVFRKILRKNRQLLAGYGVSLKTVHRTLKDQGYACPICHTELQPRDLWRTPGHASAAVVDHNHTTNDVRGVLCFKCNIIVGWIESNVEQFNRAQGYINHYSG